VAGDGCPNHKNKLNTFSISWGFQATLFWEGLIQDSRDWLLLGIQTSLLEKEKPICS
jgi:hypothetical protein